MTLAAKGFSAPDEVREFANGRISVVHLGEVTVGRAEFEPGFVWSNDVGPIAGTTSCLAVHTGCIISGRLHVRLDDGTEGEAGPGDVFTVPPGHDAWVVGNEPCVLLDFTGMESFAKRA